MTIVWMVALVAFIVTEGLTDGLVSVWFAVGSLAALAAAYAQAGVTTQIGLFLLVSIVTLLAVRPFTQKLAKRSYEPTNADRVLGCEAVVSQTIDNVAGQGAVQVAGQPWTARSETGVTIPEGARVRVERLEGVKVFVTPL